MLPFKIVIFFFFFTHVYNFSPYLILTGLQMGINLIWSFVCFTIMYNIQAADITYLFFKDIETGKSFNSDHDLD